MADRDPWAPGWADGFSKSELLRRASIYRDIAMTPGIYVQHRNAAEQMARRLEEAARAAQ